MQVLYQTLWKTSSTAELGNFERSFKGETSIRLTLSTGNPIKKTLTLKQLLYLTCSHQLGLLQNSDKYLSHQNKTRTDRSESLRTEANIIEVHPSKNPSKQHAEQLQELSSKDHTFLK
ncbi:uncharacterized protein LOC128241553 [Mya arenaria]|uniref:uncharacterized protein LOC128241553 n=1 Tax=Mya arenaria TaxID=6604 RepID=UPI0022E751D1|nr:uncharacterized protein LOC128241553 [Mya arenaria]